MATTEAEPDVDPVIDRTLYSWTPTLAGMLAGLPVGSYVREVFEPRVEVFDGMLPPAPLGATLMPVTVHPVEHRSGPADWWGATPRWPSIGRGGTQLALGGGR